MPRGTGTYGSQVGRPKKMPRREANPPKNSRTKPRAKKTSEEGLPLDTMKEGSLKKQLKVKDTDPSLKISELRRLQKLENGESGDFRGRSVKMTPLMKKRVNLGITLMKLPKK